MKLKQAEDQIKNNKKEIDKLKKENSTKERELFSLREEKENKEQPISQDYINLSYYLGEPWPPKKWQISQSCLHDVTSPDLSENLESKIDFPSKKEFEEFSQKFKTIQQNFNRYVYLLVETSNKALDQFKKIYLKIKGKNWNEKDNTFIKMHNIPIFNINQEISWTNLNNIHITISNIINEIFDLVNPKKECDPQKLNEDSCDFLMNYINGLRKFSFLQKDIDEKAFDKGENFEEKKQNSMNFEKFTKEVELYLDKNWEVLNNQNYLELFKNDFDVRNTEILSQDDYIKNFKSLVKKAKNISEKQVYEFNLHSKNSQKKMNALDDIEMQMSANKIKGNNNNGI